MTTVCTNCGHAGETATKTPGSIWIELILWLCFIVPGVIYSLWRHSARHQVCSACGSRELVPASSPKGKALIAALPPVPAPPPLKPSRAAVGAGHAVGSAVGKLLGRRA